VFDIDVVSLRSGTMLIDHSNDSFMVLIEKSRARDRKAKIQEDRLNVIRNLATMNSSNELGFSISS
jgi:hypothetical protein